jgi:23S rRNA (cytidine1920-2'-O)/16S rRNA (cytidine1409-2'-O)-methyltransferase
MTNGPRKYVSRSAEKLIAALDTFDIDAEGAVCADLGCNVGGFTQVLLKRGARRVYAVDTGYGALDYTLRKDPRVQVMERTNAMHVTLPEPCDLVVIDVAWTRQVHILPAAGRLLGPGGRIVTLVKPHYEAARQLLRNGVLPDGHRREVLDGVLESVAALGFRVLRQLESPIAGQAGNMEELWLLAPAD